MQRTRAVNPNDISRSRAVLHLCRRFDGRAVELWLNGSHASCLSWGLGFHIGIGVLTILMFLTENETQFGSN